MTKRKDSTRVATSDQHRKRIRDHDKSNGTLVKYLPKVKLFKEWMAREYPSHFDAVTGELLLITYDQLEDYLETMMYNNKDKELDADKRRCILPNSLVAYWAAIKHYYANIRIPRILISEDSELQMDCERFFQGYRNKIAGDKQIGVLSNKSGKSHFTMTAYKTVCEVAFFVFNIDMWCFTVLCWNLVARGETVGNLSYDHIEWDNDCIVVKFPKTKNDQSGAFANIPKHIYCNPHNYLIDPFFALAMLILHRPCYNLGLFSDSGDITHLYGEWLRTSLAQKTDEEQTALFGSLASMFGSHSNRKGAVTYLCNAIVSGVSIISIFMRAGWSVSKQHNPYFHQGDGGDHYCGRSVAGLNVLNYDFASLPPRFNPTLPSPTVEDYRVLISGYDNYPSSFKGVIPYLIAAAIHHLSYGQSRMKVLDTHIIYQSKLWVGGYVEKYKKSIIVGNFSCKLTDMCATGIPAHLVSSHNLQNTIGARIDRFETNLDAKIDSLQEGVNELIGRNTNTINTTMIMSSPMSANIATELATVFDKKCESFETYIKSFIVEKFDSLNKELVTACTTEEHETNNVVTMYTWGGKNHCIPQGYLLFPKNSIDNINSLWMKWFFVDKTLKIGPLRCIKPSWDLCPNERKLYSKLNKVIVFLMGICIEQKYISSMNSFKTISEGDCNQLFSLCYRYFYFYYHLNKNPTTCNDNVTTLTFTYMYRIINSYNS